MSDVATSLAHIRERIETACLVSGRNIEDVALIAVTKNFPASIIREAVDAGQLAFGENRLQEALPKLEALPSHLHWHFIGRVQTNKLRKILENFEFIHGIDSSRLAAAADRIGAEIGVFPRVFLQVNIAGEASKGGFMPEALLRELPALLALPRLEIQGLMAIPPPGGQPEDSRPHFAALRQLRDRLEAEHSVSLPGLSMGMSDDFEVAIAEGATCVRVGSAIFGARRPQPPANDDARTDG